MASVKKGIIIYKGDNGRPRTNNTATSRISGFTGLDDTKLATFAGVVEGHSKCNVAARSYNVKTTMTEAAPGADANVDVQEHIFMKNPADDSIVRFTIAAPLDADFEETSEGTRTTAAALDELVDAYNACCGLTDTAVLVGLYGTKTQKK